MVHMAVRRRMVRRFSTGRDIAPGISPDMIEPLLNTKQAAERLGTSVRALERLRSSGDGPRYCRIGPRLVGYRPADLNTWLEARSFAHRADELSRADRAA